ncbi:Benzylsuccinate synthase alpha subunit [Enhygromyxa salina]|uniref:Benzylsuccinate synthase alpha subunit n=1 Tax=Enhygromyxa salina TaxID=215803 RepID=A0A2S9XXP6_9BACT|nr:pyruvate formate lyase family protein [Enhygromyxa salina]PRP97614.1 Benzylsuccinate synthase alpha subunit [Enhygromyxa salina]
MQTVKMGPAPSAAVANHGIPASGIPALPRLERLREAILAAPYGLCTQKAELMTEAMRVEAPQSRLAKHLAPLHFDALRKALEDNLASGAPVERWQLQMSKRLQELWLRLDQRAQTQPLVVSFAKALAHTLARAELQIHADELLVGNPTRHRVGAALHPDYGGMLLMPELDRLDARAVNPMRTTPGQRWRLEHEVFPFWFSRSVMARGPLFAADLELPNKLTEGRRFVLTQFAGISHVTPDFPRVLELGFVGIREQLREARRDARSDEQAAFYEAGEIVASAVIEFGARWSRRCADEARRLEPSDPARAAELRELAQILARVPAHPARSFHEALQSVISTWVAVHQESFQHGVSFGRVDQYLWPYYERDLAAGRIDRARAVELLGCVLAKASEQLPLFNQMATEFFSGLSSASGLTLGGTTNHGATGADASNELTSLWLLAYDRMRLRQPNLHLRLHERSPRALRELAFEIIGRGGGQPALFNEAQIIPALRELGVSDEDARNFSIVGCVEWGVPYSSFPAAGAGFISLPAVLDEVLREPTLRSHVALSSLMATIWSAFCERLAETVCEAVAGNDAIERAHAQCRPTPLLSILVDGCIEAGRDVTQAGARYDSTGIQGVGLADVADSLAAIEELVVEQGRLSLAELMRAVDLDFRGHDQLRSRLVEKVPKYGQDHGRPERWAAEVARAYAEELRRHRNPRGGPYAPGFWSMTTHVGFGARLGALPSGRAAGRPLANGVSPTNGADSRGPTASLLAVTGVGGAHVSNGLALNESLDPQLAGGPTGAALVDALTRGYFAAGGMQVQYNVIDVNELIDAKRYPDRHRGLVVRISGYSAYFNDLTPTMKDELIARASHGRPGAQVSTEGAL